MNELETLVDELDMIEWRIKAERARFGGRKAPLAALLATGDARPLAEYRASRRRVRALERECDRLLCLVGPSAPGLPER